MFALVSPASLCPRDRSELPLKVSCQPPVKQSFYINKMEIWHLKSETLKAPVAFFFFFYGEMSVSTQLCEEHGLSSKKERAHNVPPSIDSLSHANTSHKTLFFCPISFSLTLNGLIFPDITLCLASKDEREVLKHAGSKTLKGCIHAFFILPKTTLLSCRLMKRKTGMAF